MAAKRFSDDHPGTDQNRLSEKRMRNTPSFASVIKEVVMINSMANFCTALEPLLRRVVNEEVDRGIRRALVLSKSPSLRIQAMEPSNLQLVFSKELSLPIFTGSKILDIENNPLQVLLVDTSNQQHMMVASPIKIELVVLDGDFQPGDLETTWTSEDFYKMIVKERAGKRPLIAGEVNLTMREGVVTVGDLEFTDNSSWIRSRRFRIGAKVAHGSFKGMRVREAISETFVVRDHRGELYMKHHPPALSDEVWRLEKIGKDGAFHRKLSEKGIKTVQDFLKLSVVDPHQLKTILGMGMSDRMWEITIKHARTCDMGTKSYIFRAPSSSSDNVFYFNPICQVVKAMVNGQFYSSRDINGIINKGYIDHLVKQAYATWDSLQQVDHAPLSHITPLLTLGELLSNNQLRQTDFPADRCVTPNSIEHGGSSNWMMNNPSYIGTPIIDSIALYHAFADSPPDGGDLSPSRSYISGV